uniref:Uncharacterized protein n=1 Tax=Setaria italica TaxID=4555 RepID=K4A4A0_SETIT
MPRYTSASPPLTQIRCKTMPGAPWAARWPRRLVRQPPSSLWQRRDMGGEPSSYDAFEDWTRR